MYTVYQSDTSNPCCARVNCVFYMYEKILSISFMSVFFSECKLPKSWSCARYLSATFVSDNTWPKAAYYVKPILFTKRKKKESKTNKKTSHSFYNLKSTSDSEA